jgi:D-serine deaminase-like pyridoxal phosphate-dependent protein
MDEPMRYGADYVASVVCCASKMNSRIRTMKLESIKTPALVLDIARVKRNAQRMSQRIKQFGADLRPHVKTHKCLEVARLQTEGHSGAITVSTLAEARAFSAHGFSKITYAIPIEPGKFDEAIEISRECELSLITDDTDVPKQLNTAARRQNVNLNLFLKVDCGYHRCGVEPTTREALEIPRQIADASNLRFAGILTHAGHSYHCQSKTELLELAKHERDLMTDFADTLRRDVGDVPIVSIGSTPTITSIDHLDGSTKCDLVITFSLMHFRQRWEVAHSTTVRLPFSPPWTIAMQLVKK